MYVIFSYISHNIFSMKLNLPENPVNNETQCCKLLVAVFLCQEHIKILKTLMNVLVIYLSINIYIS